jgi:hypothetical protein
MAVTMLSIMKPVLGTPDGHGRLAGGRDGDADAQTEDIGEGRIALVLVDHDEAARIGQPSMPRTAATPRKAGSIIE